MTQKNIKTIYIDMDGVLANLYDYLTLRIINKLYVNTTEQEKEILKNIFKHREKFMEFFPEGPQTVFESLDPYPFNKELIETVTKFQIKYTILTRPSSLDLKGTAQAKINWVKKHLSFYPPEDVLVVNDKTANGRAKGNILIDDFEPFLLKWGEKGGTAIGYKAWQFNSGEEVQKYISTMESFLYK